MVGEGTGSDPVPPTACVCDWKKEETGAMVKASRKIGRGKVVRSLQAFCPLQTNLDHLGGIGEIQACSCRHWNCTVSLEGCGRWCPGEDVRA